MMNQESETMRKLKIYWDKSLGEMTREELEEWLSQLPLDQETKAMVRKELGLDNPDDDAVLGIDGQKGDNI